MRIGFEKIWYAIKICEAVVSAPKPVQYGGSLAESKLVHRWPQDQVVLASLPVEWRPSEKREECEKKGAANDGGFEKGVTTEPVYCAKTTSECTVRPVLSIQK